MKNLVFFYNKNLVATNLNYNYQFFTTYKIMQILKKRLLAIVH